MLRPAGEAREHLLARNQGDPWRGCSHTLTTGPSGTRHCWGLKGSKGFFLQSRPPLSSRPWDRASEGTEQVLTPVCFSLRSYTHC